MFAIFSSMYMKARHNLEIAGNKQPQAYERHDYFSTFGKALSVIIHISIILCFSFILYTFFISIPFPMHSWLT